MRNVIGVLIVLGIAACAGTDRAHRQADGSVFDPVCAADGSIVRNEFANSQGNYNGIKTSRENCPWNR